MRKFLFAVGAVLLSVCGTSINALAADREKSKEAARSQLPNGFVRLGEVAPAIVIDIRYATRSNFTGEVVPGYRANHCILAEPVARALTRVQKAVHEQGYSLKVYDCYRPVRAVQAFVRWASGNAGGQTTKFYYPRIARHQIIPLGYIAERSSHSLGTAIDVTLVRRVQKQVPKTSAAPAVETGTVRDSARRAHEPEATCVSGKTGQSNGEERNRGDAAGHGDSVGMGTSWDCFDVLSHTRNRSISAVAKVNRDRLVKAMQEHGFRNYSREWWHFSMPIDGFKRARDFPVE